MRTSTVLTLLVIAAIAIAQVAESGKTSFGPAQSAAELIQDSADADAAFLASGMLNEDFDAGDLVTLLQFPADEIVILELDGRQVLDAFERSVSQFPSNNSGFLQLAGASGSFSASAPSGERVVSASIGGQTVAPEETYRVAMPSSLARGALGYFTVWSRDDVVERTGVTVEQVLSGRSVQSSSPKWTELP